VFDGNQQLSVCLIVCKQTRASLLKINGYKCLRVYYIILCHVMSCHIILYYVMSCYIILYYIVLYYNMLYYIILCYVILHYIIFIILYKQ